MVTVLGASGFIGSNLLKKLISNNISFYAPDRNENWKDKYLGDIIYCIGLSADFRKKPFETVDAHVSILNELLRFGNFNSLTYLSSTRVYVNSTEDEAFENSSININIYDPEELYTLTKLTGERLCLSSGRNTKIARLSNVYGPDYLSENFINSIIKDIKKDGSVNFLSTPDSSKDYIAIETVTHLLLKIALNGNQDIYNVASGENISNVEIIKLLESEFSFEYKFDKEARSMIFPKINIEKIKNEFGFSNSDNRLNLLKHIKAYKNDSN